MSRQKNKIVLTVVIADLIHVGHIRMLERCKKLGNMLVVGVGSDILSAKYKRLPIISEDQRLEIIKALRCVDKAELIDDRIGSKLIKKYNVNIFVRGNDRKEPELEKKVKVVYLPKTEGVSSSKIIKEIENRYKMRL